MWLTSGFMTYDTICSSQTQMLIVSTNARSNDCRINMNKHFRSEMTCRHPQKNDTSQDLTLSKHVKTLATLARDQDTWWLFGHMLFIHCRWRFWDPLFIQARWCFGHPLLIQASWCFGHPLLIQASWWSRCFRHPLPFWTCEMWSFNGFHMFPCLLKAQISSNF